MNTVDVESLRQIKTLPSLVKFLRDELDWPVEADEIDELTFDYAPEELGLDSKYAKMVKEIKQIRPLDSKQPWGIFWVNFEKKRLPMVVLRRILGNLVIKRRASARKTDRPSWHLNDLLFISSYGEEDHRTISFAHFAEETDTDQLPVLRVLGWDDQNSIMNLDRVGNRLHSHLRWPADSKTVDAWRKRWSEAFTDRYREAIRSADDLIPRLAALAAGVRVRVRDVLHAETDRGPMRRLFAAVQKLLIHDMDEDRFADMYAQTVAYGLLSARFSRQADITPQNLVELTAVSNPFLENLLENLFRLNRGKFHFDVDEVGINDVLDLLRNTNIEAIKAAFSDKSPAEDPVIRFYEGFLKQYDPQQRIQRGVFFTPRPVVSYIVRSVHELLQTEFGLEDGLASTATWADMKSRFPELTIPKGAKPDDLFVCILDPAVGTGTFLFECIEVVERTMKDKWCRQLGNKRWSDPQVVRRWREYVPKYLLPRLYGFELMMAPYAIAHLKLALKLGETGYQFRENDRLHIYLTNSLEQVRPLAESRLVDMFTTLAEEAEAVNEIKSNKRFTVIVGNPPYAAISANLTPELRRIVDPYRYVAGARIKERSMLQFEKNIQDDYVKFFAIGQRALDSCGVGLLGYVTNHSYLDGPTLRGLRWSLIENSTRLMLLDLHGNANKAEIPPPGQDNKNVFEIKQGVAIVLLAKHVMKKKSNILLGDLWGTREQKYATLLESLPLNLDYRAIRPEAPYFYFVVPSKTADDWDTYPTLPVLFPKYSTGTETGFNDLLMNFSRQELKTNLERFIDPSSSISQLQCDFNIDEGHAEFVFQNRRLLHGQDLSNLIKPFQFHAFDYRVALLKKNLLKTNSFNVMLDLTSEYPGLVTTRQTKEHFAVFVSRGFCGHKCTSSYDRSYVFPISSLDRQGFQKERVSCLAHDALKHFANLCCLDLKNNRDELALTREVFNYTYALLSAPSYSARFGTRLRRDFPRLPLTSSSELFYNLAQLGAELTTLHLMESPKLDVFITNLLRSGEFQVEKVSYSGGAVWLNKAKTRGFRNVPEEVWNFHIGGYQVCEKWLKDRQAKGGKNPRPGRVLSEEDIDHYQKIVVAINETIKIMKQIDEVIAAHGGWPIK